MIQIYCLSFLSIFLFTPFGVFFKKGTDISSYSLQLIYGIIIVSFIALLSNFFISLNQYFNSFFIILGILIIFKYKKIYLKKKYFLFCIFSSTIIFLLITKSQVYVPDAGLYHLPYVRILNDEKIILGISNLHFRFGHTSILQYTSAIFNNLIFKENGIIFPAAIIASSIIINFLSHLKNKIKLREYDFHLFYIFSILIFIFYKMNRYSEYGNDAPTHFLMFLLISEMIREFNKVTVSQILNYFILTIFIIMNKIILGLSILIPLFLFIRKLNFQVILNKKLILIIFFCLIWFTKNVLVSGCVIYPVKSSCINNFIWTDSNLAKKISLENEAWAKGWPDYRNKYGKISHSDYLKDFFWIKTWASNHLIVILKILLPYILFLLLTLFFFKIDFKKFKINYYQKFLITVFSIGSILWFVKIPTFRYGYSYIVIFLSLYYSALAVNIRNTFKLEKLIKITIIVLLCIFVTKNLVRIIFSDSNYNNYPWTKFYSYTKDNIRIDNKFKIINNKKIYYPVKDYCMYGNSPCGYIKDNLDVVNFKSYLVMYLLDK